MKKIKRNLDAVLNGVPAPFKLGETHSPECLPKVRRVMKHREEDARRDILAFLDQNPKR